MAGVYLHIPFCKQACHYCDFHFSVNQTRKPEIVDALISEIQLQKNYLGSENVKTIYFGGGTPSLLNDKELGKIMDALSSNFELVDDIEITLEANPDDLTPSKLKTLRDLGINRLSIGIQSFHDDALKYLNRAHGSKEALNCIDDARRIGFDNLSIDLIYAIPSDNHENWKHDLKKVIELQPNHISSYCLTIEPQTTFGRRHNRGELTIADEEFAARQFEILLDTLKSNGYQQYEISNFCKEEAYSRHNSNYWRQENYLGIGPSAHSYNGTSRQFNINHNQKYLRAINQGIIPAELEVLSLKDQINEYILTTLRTAWGVSLRKLKEEHSYVLINEQNKYIDDLLIQGLAVIKNDHLILTDQGKLLADKISSDMFLLE